uniref:2,3-bisphosphoglycerate-independent phosphoglycerate mutase n=1 Tax=Rhodymenia pseudopalmata TaxID=31502 RepID=A0A1C9C7L3_RHOPU|nr:phosphoglycerate mutase [Rhodymenia pseudopalmata]AOM64367.1 phosphoglycerate mutase [Rhodymenia pseudopalmata]
MTKRHRHTIILTILDGWGYSENIKGNAIQLSETPTLDKIWKEYPHTLLKASGEDVGLPLNQMGNSEVGHTTIGAGRTINQDLVRITKSIENNDFFTNSKIHAILQSTEKKKSKLHIIGLCSDGGVHSHINHLLALIEIAKQYKPDICLHIITDGRDTEANIAKKFIEQIMLAIEETKNIKICTISGRYYSMDRDCRWSRTEKAYKTLVEDNMSHPIDPLDVIESNYRQNISDEFIPPIRINQGAISDNDSIIFFNFRPDRIRQILHSLAKKTFKGFSVKTIKALEFLTFSQYDANLNIPAVFPPEKHKKFLGEIISSHGFKQFRLAETEKYAHVTYFFNGGTEEPLPGEDRELICSPQVDTYDLAPEMSAYKLTESALNAIKKNTYKLIVINYANSDMVGHTGNLEATIKAVKTIDQCIKKLIQEVEHVKGTLIITADHGNAECMIDEENKPCKSHTTNLVPFSLIEYSNSNIYHLRQHGCLADIAPTILSLFNIEAPIEMNGSSLITKISNTIL